MKFLLLLMGSFDAHAPQIFIIKPQKKPFFGKQPLIKFMNTRNRSRNPVCRLWHFWA